MMSAGIRVSAEVWTVVLKMGIIVVPDAARPPASASAPVLRSCGPIFNTTVHTSALRESPADIILAAHILRRCRPAAEYDGHVDLGGVFFPLLSALSFPPMAALAEEERMMTVEQWISHEIDVQYERLKRDGEMQIQMFIEQAAETRKRIEALLKWGRWFIYCIFSFIFC